MTLELNKVLQSTKWTLVCQGEYGGVSAVAKFTDNLGNEADVLSYASKNGINVPTLLYAGRRDQLLISDFEEEIEQFEFVIITEFIDGSTVELLAPGANDVNAKIVHSIYEQLLKMHSVNIVHSDFYDNNIIVDKNNKPWILDFEMSYIEGVSTYTGSKSDTLLTKSDDLSRFAFLMWTLLIRRVQ